MENSGAGDHEMIETSTRDTLVIDMIARGHAATHGQATVSQESSLPCRLRNTSGEIGEHVAQTFLAEGVEAFRHEADGQLAHLLDVVELHFHRVERSLLDEKTPGAVRGDDANNFGAVLLLERSGRWRRRP